MENVCDFVCLCLVQSLFIVWWSSADNFTQSWPLSAPGNQICWPPALTQLCPGLLFPTKPVWPPHQSNSRSLLPTTPHLHACVFETPFVLFLFYFFPAAGLFCGYLISHAAACGLWLDCDVFVLVFKTSVAIHSGSCDPCMCVSDRKERSLLRGFTVN